MDNHYQAPASAPADPAFSTYQPRFLSLSGRIGRLRYLAYCMGLMLITYPVIFIIFSLSGLFTGQPPGPMVFISLAVVYLALLVFTFGYAVRRLNDMDQSGWLSLLMLIPLVNVIMVLVLLFARGTAGSNRYGPAPVPNTKGVVVLALIPLLFAVLGIVAAISLPAYQQYILQAEQMQQAFE
ncbi:DNA translocase FtsK [Isoalcanivorax pacificus W11-5]|uniref:DNA translocase FtsK n=1 Tax=Isoalcanivorax pacificus W11-5 TaxID=391936 RepID=A0A0B4XNU1_9GAMM|nr:DUF805 domain-containing protein [Isoalcanivorax pacificus]AJD48148.1 DNA translocase FtsK [Isoalcanivorax pacificus W11-5]